MANSTALPAEDVIGVLLINLGSPDSPSTPDVRRYLKQFLSDRRVIQLPRIIWWPILNFIILNTRPKRSALAYQKIWTQAGSPLITISQQQSHALQAMLDGDDQAYYVISAMRYGHPSIAQAMAQFKQRDLSRMIVLPLYPQFSHTTTSSVLDAVERALQADVSAPQMHFIHSYHTHRAYIQALAVSIQEHWDTHGHAEQFIFSFHGIPQAYIQAGDPYEEACYQTVKLLAKKLKLDAPEYMLSFQSRLGPKKWLQPYTDQTLIALAQSGVKSVQIICPGFSVDCLETLAEIQMENRELFIKAGGERYEYIPCLNLRSDHIQLMAKLVRQQTQQRGSTLE